MWKKKYFTLVSVFKQGWVILNNESYLKYYIFFIINFKKNYSINLFIFLKPILHLIFTFFIYYWFYKNKIELLALDQFNNIRFYLLLIIILLFLLFLFFIFFYKKWILLKKIIIKSLILILNVIVNLYLICYFCDITLKEFISYNIIILFYNYFYLLCVLYIFIFSKDKKKKEKIRLFSFIQYPYIYICFYLILYFLFYFKDSYVLLEKFINFSNDIFSNFFKMEKIK